MDKHMQVKITNNGKWTKESIDYPITVDDKCIGVITDVDDEYVYGTIWDRFINETILCDDKRIIGMKIG